MKKQLVTISLLPFLSNGTGAKEIDDVITVTANRVEQDITEVSSAVSVFDQEDVERIQPSTIDDLFRAEPGVEFTGGPRVVGEQLQIRAQDGDSVTVRVDGARQNFVSGHSGQRFFVDPLLLQSSEVIRGGKSNLFGSGAAGVVNFETLKPSAFLEEGKLYGGRIQAGYQEVNDETNFSAVFATGTEDLSVLFGYAQRTSDDIELGNGETLSNSALDRENIILNAEFRASEEHSFNLGYNYYISEDQAGANPQADVNNTSNTLVGRELEFNQVKGGYDWDSNTNDWINLKANAYYNRSTQFRDYLATSGSNVDRQNEHVVETIGFDVLNKAKYKALGAESILISGFEYYQDEQEGFETRDTFFSSGGAGTSSGRPDADLKNFALYVENSFQWDNGFQLSAGLRYDDYSSSSNDFSIDESQLSPHVGIRYEAFEGFSFFGDYSRAFTAPTLNELYADGSHFGIVPTAFFPAVSYFEEVFVPNTDLEAESSDNFEVGIDYDADLWGGVIDLRASYFVQFGENTFDSEITGIVTNPFFFGFAGPGVLTQGLRQTVNRDETTIQGIEVDLNFSKDNWYTRLTYSNISAEDDSTGEDLNTTPGDKLYLEGGYTFFEDLTIGANALFVGSREDKVSDAASKTSAYDIYGLFATWEYNEAFTFTAGVNNLLGQSYERTNVNNTEAGRNIFFSGTYRF